VVSPDLVNFLQFPVPISWLAEGEPQDRGHFWLDGKRIKRPGVSRPPAEASSLIQVLPQNDIIDSLFAGV
jgi:hypothetical protein